MLASLESASVIGIHASPVHIEVDLSFGLPLFHGRAARRQRRESRDRVRAAIRNSGFDFPPHRITVNLAPADVRKAGTAFDLPIALGILAAAGVRAAPRHAPAWCIVGELSLDGAMHAAARRAADRGGRRDAAARAACCCPAANAAEAAVVEASACCRCARWPTPWAPATSRERVAAVAAAPRHRLAPPAQPLDLADVRGQAFARRALEVAAAGGHNLLMSARPARARRCSRGACRRSCRRSPSTRRSRPRAIHSVAGLLPPGGGLLASGPSARRTTPSRTPALVGGGSRRGPARSASPTTACCSSTRCRSSSAACSRRCGSRSRTGRDHVSRAARHGGVPGALHAAWRR